MPTPSYNLMVEKTTRTNEKETNYMFGLTMHDSCQACLLIPPGIYYFLVLSPLILIILIV